MATIKKRGNTWQAKIRRKGYPKQTATFDTKREAEQWSREIETQIDRGQFLERTTALRTILRDLLQRYAHEVCPKNKGGEVEQARIRVMLRDEISEYSLAHLTPAEIAKFRDRRLAAKKSGSTVNRDLSLLSAIISHARREWSIYLHENPVFLVTRPKENPGRERRLDPSEEQILRKALAATGSRDVKGRFTKGPRNQWMLPFFLLALETGLRRSELLRLQWMNIDAKRRTARIVDTKNGDSRTIPLSSRAIGILEGLERHESGKVFPMTANAVKLAWQRIKKSVPVEDFNFHDTRHEATSRFFEMGLTDIEVASITGHKDLRILKRYTHLRSENIAKKLG